MIKKENGITLVSLIITIALMTIIASTVVYISLDRFEVNNLKKMYNDIELLQDKVSIYNLKYGELPKAGKYTLSLPSTITKNTNDNNTYYIIDLNAMEGISLNYGKGLENGNTSDDVYIINEKSKQIYYVKGIQVQGNLYHTNTNDNNTLEDNIPPSKPQINVISGTKVTDEDGNEYYTTEVEIEIIPGKDAWSGVNTTTVTITKDGVPILPETIKINDLYIITETGIYNITVITEDNSGQTSQIQKTLEVEIVENNS